MLHSSPAPYSPSGDRPDAARWSRAVARALLLSIGVVTVAGLTVPASPAVAANRPAGKKAPKEPEVVVEPAGEEQLEASKRVFYGVSPCEMNQRITLSESTIHPGYVDLQFGTRKYLMKPMVSRSGAVRLEDVRKETLMVQIGSKSMLMNQKTGQRLADQCVNPEMQRPDD